MSCSEVVFQTVHGLGFGGLSSKSVVPFKKSLSDAPRVVCSILVLTLGLGALVCGIAITCWCVPGVILMGGICAIVLGAISLALSLFWLWGLFSNCCGSKRVLPGEGLLRDKLLDGGFSRAAPSGMGLPGDGSPRASTPSCLEELQAEIQAVTQAIDQMSDVR
uniref:Uncharacterized protein n=1 Tax=Chlamydia pneumoniae TaxID=83558 RepID=A0A0F7WS51_CHLPN|nr:Uncharacterized protein BN1224_DC9_AR_00030 [Chlamydia pneumoniae]